MRNVAWVVGVGVAVTLVAGMGAYGGSQVGVMGQEPEVAKLDVEVERAWEGHTREVQGVAFSPDGKLIASAGYDELVKLWNAETGELVREFKGHDAYVTCVAFSPDGKRLASGGWDGCVRIWDVETGALVRALEGHEKSVRGVAFSPDGTRVVSGSADMTARIWDVETGKVVHVLKGKGGNINGVAWQPDGGHVATAGWGDNRLWNAKSGLVRQYMGEGGVCVAFNATGDRVAFGCAVIDVEDGRTVAAWDGHSGGFPSQARGVAFSPDGRVLVTTAYDKAVRWWDAATGQALGSGEIGGVGTCVAFSPDGRRVVSGGWDGKVIVWRLRSGDPR